MIEEALHDVPVEYRDRFESLISEEPVDLARLRHDVEVYIDTVKQVGLMVKLLDMGQAERLAETSIALLDHAKGASKEVVTLVQAAVQYFVVEEEDEEITGVLGFDDDVQVLNAVSRAIGRHDLVIAGL